MALSLEPLEERQLLSVYTGFSQVRNIATSTGIYTLQVSGPGILKAAPAGHGAIDLKVLGTNTTSSLSITQVRPALSPCRTALADPQSHDQVRTDRATSWPRLSSSTAR